MSAEADSRGLAIPPGGGGSSEPAPGAEPGAEPAPPTATGPGARLRAAREARGLGIQQVVDSLHIEPRLVEALEQDRYDAFDAPVYARGFLKKYGTFLGLPADELLAGYEALHRGPVPPSLVPVASAERKPTDWSPWRRFGLGVVAVVLVGGSYWWWLTRSPVAPPVTEVSSLADETPATGGAGPAAGDGEPVEIAGGPPGASPGGDATATAPVETPREAGPAGIAPAPEASATGAAAAQPAPAVAGGTALQVAFVGECWLEVYDPGGRRLAYDLHRAGESRTLPGPGPWRVFLGAVDSARVSIAGRPVVVPQAARNGATASFTIDPDGTLR